MLIPRRGQLAAPPAVHVAVDQLHAEARAEAERLALLYVALPIGAGLLVAGLLVAGAVYLAATR